MDKSVQFKVNVEQIIANLHRKRKEILSLPPEKALDEILDFPQADALVHSFPQEDFYFLIHDIGVEDSVELLSLASNRQWEYILDVEVWKRDRITLPAVTNWLYMLLKADPKRLIRWSLTENTEFIEFYLSENIEVLVREHDQDPSDFGEDFFTFDDMFYVKFTDIPYDHKLLHREKRDEFLSEFLNRLAVYDHITYQQVLLEFATVIPAESEEDAYRLRNMRLAERGFMPFDEAVGVYQPLKPESLKTQVKHLIKRDGSRLSSVPLYPLEMLKEDNLFTRSLQVIDIHDILQQLQTEFAGLCNQVIAADQKLIREREELKHIVKKVCGYVSIGLECLTEEKTGDAISASAAAIQKFPLSRIFRVGYGLALELKWRAERWRKESWFEKTGLPLGFWGEEWLGVLGGLLIKKPLFFDNYKTGSIYREFASTDDVRITETILDEIMAFDHLLLRMFSSDHGPEIRGKAASDSFFTYKKLVLTLWARHCLGLPEAILPLSLNEFRTFFDNLWAGDEEPRKISISMKESFLAWLISKISMDAYNIIQESGQTLENLFGEIETEYGEVSGKDLDPRYIHLFLMS